jgi:hypothetical protein
VETNKSIHCYSPLSEPLPDLEIWKTLQERLIQRMDSDPAIRNSSRLMRLPGFDHVRVESEGQGERLVFTPVTLRHIDRAARQSVGKLETKLPPWSEARWQKERTTRAERQQGQTEMPTLATDNPWDIRNFAQHLNGDHLSRNSWFQVQCPSHGGEGHSGNSLHINEATGQFKCHGGCDTKDIYTAAWQLAEERGWEPPQKEDVETEREEVKALPIEPPKIVEAAKKQRYSRQWLHYSQEFSHLPEPQRDLHVARKALEQLSQKEAIALLAKNSDHARRLYQEQGSTPAYNYVSSTVKTALRSLQQQRQQKTNGIET